MGDQGTYIQPRHLDERVDANTEMMMSKPGEMTFPVAIEPARRSALTDDIFERIKSLIMDLQVEPGSRINMDLIARQLGVSITPLREALSRLESEGLVVKYAMRGYVAAPVITRKEFDDLYVLRLQLEPWAAGMATRRAEADDILALAAELASAPPAPTERHYDDYRAFANHDARFHAAVHAVADNGVVASALARTHAHLHLFRLSYAGESGIASITEHQAVFDAIRRGDALAAETAMRAHLENSRDRLRRSFDDVTA